jgi:prephenate dehydratase
MPIQGSNFKYGFYADLEFEKLVHLQKVVEQLNTQTNNLKIFGIYKKGKVVKG